MPRKVKKMTKAQELHYRMTRLHLAATLFAGGGFDSVKAAIICADGLIIANNHEPVPEKI